MLPPVRTILKAGDAYGEAPHAGHARRRDFGGVYWEPDAGCEGTRCASRGATPRRTSSGSGVGGRRVGDRALEQGGGVGRRGDAGLLAHLEGQLLQPLPFELGLVGPALLLLAAGALRLDLLEPALLLREAALLLAQVGRDVGLGIDGGDPELQAREEGARRALKLLLRILHPEGIQDVGKSHHVRIVSVLIASV
jgi:hypothetical protein